MPTTSEPDSGQLNKEEVQKALENVSYLFPDDHAAAASSKDSEAKPRLSSRRDSAASHGSGTHISARSRVDSSARPAQFMLNGDKKGAGLHGTPIVRNDDSGGVGGR
jgi:hypothetical protein